MISLQETLEDERERFNRLRPFDIPVNKQTYEDIMKWGKTENMNTQSGEPIKFEPTPKYDWLEGKKAKITSWTIGPDFKESVSMEFLPEGQDLVSFFKEVGELTQRERLVRGKDKVFKKLFEEIGEYAVASLGDKEVTESPRQELVDCLIMLFSLFTLEGGNLDFLASYGKIKLDKWKKKLEEEGI
jgi:phosphoribosyl-ATP pyrophosphohydrolase